MLKKINLTLIILFGLILLLWVVQIALTFQTRFLYRYEDVGINVLPVLWFIHREVFAVSANFGWYAFLHLIYTLFGFSINTVQILRQIIQLFSLLSIGILLVRYLGHVKAVIPLLTIGLSPTLTYFVTSAAPYGIELQLLPIILLMVDSLNFKSRLSFLLESILWFLMMFGLLTYATFNFFLPVVIILYYLKLAPLFKAKVGVKTAFRHVLLSALAFLVPLMAGLVYYKHPQDLFYNPNTDLGGLFRSSSAFVVDGEVYMNSISGTFKDLFNHGVSYYYQLQNGEFSHFFPILPIIIVLIYSLHLLIEPRDKNQLSLKSVIILCWVTILANLLIANFSVDLSHLPGVRRATPILASFYVLFAIVWHKILHLRLNNKINYYFLISILLLLPLHHLLVLPDNFRHLSDKSLFSNDRRFELAETPQSFLKSQLDILTKQDLYLDCPKGPAVENLASCPYQNIFATLELSCLYNKLSCHQIFGFEPLTGQSILLNFDLFNSGDYPHLH